MFKLTGLKSCVFAIAASLATLHALAQSKSSPKDLPDLDWSKAVIVTLVMNDYEFAPKRLVFRQGVRTRLQLINRSDSIHDFTAPDFLKTVDLRDPSAIGASGKGIPIEPHQQLEIDLVPRLSGQFGLICADHDWAGMTADITVE